MTAPLDQQEEPWAADDRPYNVNSKILTILRKNRVISKEITRFFISKKRCC